MGAQRGVKFTVRAGFGPEVDADRHSIGEGFSSMFAVVNRLPVKEGKADEIVKRFSHGQGFVQEFPGFVSMEVMRSDNGDEVMVITRWRDKEAFDSWVRSDAFNAVHGRGSGGLLRGHPQMSTYEVSVTRESGSTAD